MCDRLNKINFFRINRRCLALLIGVCSWLLGSPVNAKVSCTISSPPNINFGAYDPFSTSALDGAGTGTIFCSTNRTSEAVSLSISASAGSAGSFAPRKMNGPSGNRLDYYVYIDANRTQNFGTGVSGTFVDGGSFTLRPSRTLTHTLYGRITAGQDVAVGSYTDTLVYTVNF